MRATDVIADHSAYIDRGPDLLGNRSDRITLPAIEALGTSHRSLTLIRPGHVSFYPTTSMGGNPQLRARFELRGNWYDLSVTDIRYGAQTVPDEGDYLLTVSLGVPFRPGGSNEEACFKIVAGVIQVPS